MRRVVKWVIVNTAMLLLLWAGLVQGIEGARNIALFLVWLSFFTSLACFSDKLIAEVGTRGRSVPRIVDAIFDVTVLSMLVWHGCFVSGIAYAIHMVAMDRMWSEGAKLARSAEAQ